MSRKKKLGWGRTPWDKLDRGELLREVQRMYHACEAARGVLHQFEQTNMARGAAAAPLFWGKDGSGGIALRLTDHVVSRVRDEYDDEDVYRFFFRYAVDLLFPESVGVSMRWMVCEECGRMVGSYDGARRKKCPDPECDRPMRRLRWSDLDPSRARKR